MSVGFHYTIELRKSYPCYAVRIQTPELEVLSRQDTTLKECNRVCPVTHGESVHQRGNLPMNRGDVNRFGPLRKKT